MNLYLLLLLSTICLVNCSYNPKELRCIVCKKVVLEMEKEIAKVNPKKKINLGHRINNQGFVEERTKPFARSEMHLSELMDTICEAMENYVRVTSKATGELDVIQLMTESGGMNPKFGEYDVIQDSDLNKSLKFYCEGIVEEFESEFYEVLQREQEEPEVKVCENITKLCDLGKGGDKSEL